MLFILHDWTQYVELKGDRLTKLVLNYLWDKKKKRTGERVHVIISSSQER